MLDDWQKIGVGLTGFGVFFTFLGVLMLFDKGLLAVGNLLFLSGVTLVIGARNTFSFFFQQHKIKGSSCFFGGIFLVLIGWPIIGMIVEAFGFVNLFGDFFPVIIRRLPILAQLLNFTGLREYIDKKEKRLPL